MEQKLAQFDALQQRCEMMEQAKQNGEAAADLLRQFIDAGIVSQAQDGNFVVPGDGTPRKFQPFSQE